MSKSKKDRSIEPVVISRVHPFLTGHDRRVFANGAFCTEDRGQAQKFTRRDAEALLARGRWHGLDPQIEAA